MATMIEVFLADEGIAPASNPAEPDESGGLIPVLRFDDATDETIYFKGVANDDYDGTSDIDVTLLWNFATFVASQTCDWEVSFYRIADDADTIETLTFATAQTAIMTVASAAGELDYGTITFTNAQADGLQPGELFMLRVTRDASGGTQGSPGDTQLAGVLLKAA